MKHLSLSKFPSFCPVIDLGASVRFTKDDLTADRHTKTGGKKKKRVSGMQMLTFIISITNTSRMV